ncbi:hypothetical protein C1I89_29885 [Achromobacter pulmonis]|uniref:DUF4365 domain-containing protein n=1 Tax=Achromobacter pulmonis TaxID=1389932 RepID=A0A2N8K9P5_9BURK|nr:DUF4365 domain-containing protein [Achromobacter pulmonis]PND30181.1 hypothetical protein C1I89_29885 [Achromobacter pulmonis]
MKYPEKAANGDAGEFFFAYKVASVLKWPCRLLDIDIGIDAQVEILNEDGTSTGRFVAFQVKATSVEEQSCRYVSERQLAYWRELDLPVFVVLVDLSKEWMYLHHVRLDKAYPPTKKGSVRIDFDLAKDRFDKKSAKRITAAANEAALAHIEKYLSEVREGIQSIRGEIARTEAYGNPRELIETMQERTSLREKLAQAQALAGALRIGSDRCKGAEQELDEALQSLRDHMVECNMHRDWDDDGEITRFVAEGR